jgi:hypothetical protein
MAGTTRFTALETALTLIVGTTLGVGGALQFTDTAPQTTGTGSDGVQIVYAQQARGSLTATGATADNAYEVVGYDSPLTATGAIQEFCIEVKTPSPHVTNFRVDCGVVAKGASTTSGTTLFDNEDLNAVTGAAKLHCIVPSTTEVTMGSHQQIKCKSRSGTGAGLTGDYYVKFRETVLP